MIARSVMYTLGVSGAQGVLGVFKQVGSEVEKSGKKGELTFKKLGKAAAATALQIGALFAAAIAALDPAYQKFKEFEKSWANTNRMMQLNTHQARLFTNTLLAMVDGPLGSVPGILNDSAEAMYNYTSALGATENQAVVFRDLEAGAKVAASTGQALNDVMQSGAQIAARSGLAHGSLTQIMDQLTKGEEYAIATFGELATASSLAAGSIKGLGGDVSDTIGLIAQLTKTSIGNAQKSARAIKFVAARFEAEKELLESLGVTATDFVGIMTQLGDVTLTAGQKGLLFGSRYAAGMMQMIKRSDTVVSSIEDIRSSTGLLEKQFNAFTHTTLAEVTRAENAFEKQMITLGERMKETGTTVEVVKMELKAWFTELAGAIIRNKELVIGAIVAIKMALLAFQASNPIGWVMAAMAAVIGLLASIESVSVANLRLAKASKKVTEERLAQVVAAKNQAEADLEAAVAAGANQKAIDKLRASVKSLLRDEEELTQITRTLAIEVSGYTVAVEAANTANEVGTEVLEGALEKSLKSWAEQLDTQDKINAVLTDQTVLTAELAAAGDDRTKIAEAIRGFLIDQVGLSEEQALLYTEQKMDLEEAESLIGFINTATREGTNIMHEQAALIADRLKAEWAELGVLDLINQAKEDITKLSAEEARVVTAVLDKQVAQLKTQIEMARLLATRLGMETTLGKVLFAGVTEAQKQLFELHETIAQINKEPLDLFGDGDGDGTPAGELTEEEKERISKEYKLREEHRFANLERDLSRQKENVETIARIVDKKHDKQAERIKSATELTLEQWTWGANQFAGIIGRSLFDSSQSFGKALVENAKRFVATMAQQLIQNAIIMLLLSFLPGGKGLTFAGLFKNILPFATGGIVEKPTLALVGEREREYIIPESTMKRNVGKYGPGGVAAAAAEVSKIELPSSGPTIVVEESQALVKLELTNEGIATSVDKATRARVREEG